MVLWGIAGIALLVAVVAFALTRRLARKLDALTQSYWELRYDYTRIRSQLSRLDPAEQDAQEPPAAPSAVTFVPLSSMKKKNG